MSETAQMLSSLCLGLLLAALRGTWLTSNVPFGGTGSITNAQKDGEKVQVRRS